MSRSLDEESGVVPIGRPREFDTSKAIDSAMLLFWRKGYEGTSISDLTEALGITRPSLYGAFGNKEQLFRTVLDRDHEGTAGFSYRIPRPSDSARSRRRVVARGR